MIDIGCNKTKNLNEEREKIDNKGFSLSDYWMQRTKIDGWESKSLLVREIVRISSTWLNQLFSIDLNF